MPFYVDCHVGEKEATDYGGEPDDEKECVVHDNLQ
jgi:hypothetical protein